MLAKHQRPERLGLRVPRLFTAPENRHGNGPRVHVGVAASVVHEEGGAGLREYGGELQRRGEGRNSAQKTPANLAGVARGGECHLPQVWRVDKGK